ncbi:MAG: nucleoside hydrolase [Clostridia bacterium]|nr:nucleoside hydrolase [Clostridia bacterium]MBQ6934242.1 nucleoside hydrolase [Clostridia bacterium]
MKKIPIIIDCDPGVDDSYALALANSYEGFEILAITAVEGNVPAVITRKNALCIREELGINCRIGFGAEKPLKKEYKQFAADTHGQSGVGSFVFDEPKLQSDEMPAWEIIYDEAVKHKGELVLFAVGPLTNIAICLEKHPDLPQLIKKFVIMGGGTFGNVSATNRTAEFNIWIDPHAARQVFEKMDVWMVGLNATHAAAVEMSDFDDMMAICGDNKKARFIAELSRFSKYNCVENGSDNNAIHDALAVASQMDETVVTFENLNVRVEDGDCENIGQTVIDREKEPNCHVAMSVDKAKFAEIMKNMCRYYAEK